MRVRVPAVDLLGGADLVLAQDRPVRLGGVLRVRRAVGDMAAEPDEARPVGLTGRGLESRGDRLEVGGVLDRLRVPAVGAVAGLHVLTEGDAGRAVDGDVV